MIIKRAGFHDKVAGAGVPQIPGPVQLLLVGRWVFSTVGGEGDWSMSEDERCW